jgi:hypothetical protein
VTDGPEQEKALTPRQGRDKCQRCDGVLVLTETLPRSLGSPTYEIFRCQGCDAYEWVAQKEP